MMHLAHQTMQTQMCPKYLMQTIPASYYLEKPSLAWVFSFFSPLPFTAFTSFSHADNPKNTNSTDTHTGT